MFNFRSSRSRALPAALAVLILGAAGTGIADAASQSSQELTTKAAPVVPLAARSAPRLAGSSALAPASSEAERQMRVEASQDGACDVGDVCLYYFSNFAGSRYDTAHNDANLFNNRFITAGSGQGATVGNNAMSVWNRDPNTTVYLCTGLNSTGSCGYVLPGDFGNLSSTYSNRSQSITWADSTN